ncbi:MAG: glutamyl-tRNA reductase [Chloroflexota bacterium]
MELYLTGINYSRTTATIRDALAKGITPLEDALRALNDYVTGGIVVATCNRLEVYTVADRDRCGELTGVSFLKDRSGLSAADLLPHVYLYHNEEVIEHLFRVTCGLDSVLIGEFEVLGQISRALEEANKAGPVGLPLRSLFQQAVGVGRRVRQETGISRSALSVSSVAVDLAAQVIGDLEKARILIIGAGEAGRLVAKSARDQGANEVSIAARNQEKARAIATMLNGQLISMDDLDQGLNIADIVVSCTSAPHYVLRYPKVEQAMQARPKRPLVIIDIAVPRDIDPAVKQISNVFLYDMADFTKIAETNRHQREGSMQQAQAIIDSEVARFTTWWQELETRPTITALVNKMDSIRKAELKRTLKKLPDLSDEERANLETMTRSMIQKILHQPIEHLRQHEDRDAYIKLINELFGLTKKDK